jgi:hypothetical protein
MSDHIEHECQNCGSLTCSGRACYRRLEAALRDLAVASEAYLMTPVFMGDQEIEPGRKQRVDDAFLAAVARANAALA